MLFSCLAILVFYLNSKSIYLINSSNKEEVTLMMGNAWNSWVSTFILSHVTPTRKHASVKGSRSLYWSTWSYLAEPFTSLHYSCYVQSLKGTRELDFWYELSVLLDLKICYLSFNPELRKQHMDYSLNQTVTASAIQAQGKWVHLPMGEKLKIVHPSFN